MATVLAFLFRFNKIAIYTGTFVNNPFLTLVPIIIASYAVGAYVMGRSISLPAEGLELLKNPHLLAADYWRQLFTRTRDVFYRLPSAAWCSLSFALSSPIPSL